MKALSIQPFYTTLIALLEKWIELRSWSTDYRGWILICSTTAKSKKESDAMVCGHAVAIAELTDVRPYVDETDRELSALFEDETFEGYSWVFDKIIPIKPIPIKGQLRLFNVDYELEDLELLELNYGSENYDEELFDWWLENGYIKNKAFLG